MSKPSNKVLFVPGATGWEIWTGQPGSGFTLHSSTLTASAGEVTALPAGEVAMLFPVRKITAIPFKVDTGESAMFEDLASMHAESLGMRPDPMAGQLTDTFPVVSSGESTTLLAVELKAPADGDLPVRSPKEFDISARAFPVTGDSLAVWKEFGRWVFAFYQQGRLLYCQATSVESADPDEDLILEIDLAKKQLEIQGIAPDFSRVELWSAESPDPQRLARLMGCPAQVGPRPVPVFPSPPSKLLPADVRAARHAARRKRNLTLGIAAAAIAYLGLAVFLGYGIWKNRQAAAKLNAQSGKIAAECADVASFKRKWQELAPAIDPKLSPPMLLLYIKRCIPPGGLRLKSAEISATKINLMGEAPTATPAKLFPERLGKSKDLSAFVWKSIPEPTESTRGWEFVIDVAPPKDPSVP